MARFAIITGEYPPQRGGVADYTKIVGQALVEAGDEVEIWAPLSEDLLAPTNGAPSIHRVRGKFNPRNLMFLSRALEKQKPHRVLVQYAPHAFGFKAMNLPFCLWVMKARRRHHVWVMFHEVAFPIHREQPIRYNALGAVNRIMAGLLARSAERIFVSTPSWNTLLKGISPSAVDAEWLPVPSAVSRCRDRCDYGWMRQRYASGNRILIGHFGTYGRPTSIILSEVLPRVLKTLVDTSVVLVGNGSRAFSGELICQNKALESRIHGAGFLPPHELSHLIAACDLMVQPYSDGVSTRRTTVMAALNHAKPVVTTMGELTEAIWAQSGAVALTRSDDREGLASLITTLVADRDERRRLSRAGYSFYRERFEIGHTIAALRDSV